MSISGRWRARWLMAWFWLAHRAHRGYRATATASTRGLWCDEHGQGVGYIPQIHKTIGRNT